jgi:hypothetical protein
MTYYKISFRTFKNNCQHKPYSWLGCCYNDQKRIKAPRYWPECHNKKGNCPVLKKLEEVK